MGKKLKLGVALGSGSARGWSHIGVLNALAEQGIHPDIVCGTSIGALVGASYVSNNLSRLEDWVRDLTKFDIARFFELNRSFNGFVNQERLHEFLNEYVADDTVLIEKVSKRYASISTELATGREVWHSEGAVVEAVWASISLPGLFPAINNDNRWLVDGGLVNPVPVSVCKALGADVVIAVNLNGDLVGRHFENTKQVEKPDNGFSRKVTDLVMEYTGSLLPVTKSGGQPPSLFDAIASSINITQDRITRSRLAGDPPDILLVPKLSKIGLLEFYRAGEAIKEGEKSVRRALPEIKEILGHDLT
ncbi:MAG: patatin [Gammaproteobacteria bacterium]|nr:MAG: patatin [Gammaproteobacteria bacterium]RLA24361.1 MAG: patatin [Gammaproteobacteria bacterium]